MITMKMSRDKSVYLEESILEEIKYGCEEMEKAHVKGRQNMKLKGELEHSGVFRSFADSI